MAWSTPLFSLRGTSLDAYRSQASATGKLIYPVAGTAPALVTTGLPANTYGSSYIDLVHATLRRSMGYEMLGNWVAGPCSLLLRFMPNWTGTPAATRPLLLMAGGFSYPCGINVSVNTANKIVWQMLNSGGDTVLSYISTAAFTPSANWFDLFFCTDGTTGSNATTFAMYDNAGNSIFSENTTLTRDRTASGTFDPTLASLLVLAQYASAATLADIGVNELCLWGTKETYTVRSGFITASPLNGGVNTGAGAANIRIGAAEVIYGVTANGTYDGSDRWTDPGENKVLSGETYKANSLTNNKTGTLVAPSTAQIVTAILDAAMAGHTTAGSLAALLNTIRNEAHQANDKVSTLL